MNQKIQAALKKKDSAEFLRAIRRSFPYSRPQDFAGLSRDGKLAVCCDCFALDMFSGGYLIVLDRLPKWTEDILKSLKRIGAEPYATEFGKIVRIAKQNKLRPFADTEWDDYLKKHPGFELATVRDYERVTEVVATRLRAYVKKRGSSFA
jgi:hypothetical protein